MNALLNGKPVTVKRVNRRRTGLGDAVATIAKPIARGIDAVLGTNIANCGGCGKRQQKLNELVPFK